MPQSLQGVMPHLSLTGVLAGQSGTVPVPGHNAITTQGTLPVAAVD